MSLCLTTDHRSPPVIALGAFAAAGGGALAGLLIAGGEIGTPASLGAAVAAAMAGLALAAGAWRLTSGGAATAGYSPSRAMRLGALPVLPWLAAWPLVLLLLTHPAARSQLLSARVALTLYFLGWLVAGSAATALWVRVIPSHDQRPRGTERVLPTGSSDKLWRAAPANVAAPAAWWLAAPLLALAAVAYWNGAVLDPLQFRGFPDYVTQMRGARRLLDGVLPYEPGIRVWTDVNLPPITLLMLFVPFTPFSELGGKLAFFAVNHAAFFAGLVVLLHTARPAAARLPFHLWASLVLAVALTFEPWHDSLRLGQQNGIIFFFLALAAGALLVRWETLAGVALTAALIGKPSAALLGIYFLFARRWRAAAAAAGTAAFAFLVTLPWAGVENWRFYLLEKAPQILAGTPQQSNVALLALHARLFLGADALASFDAMPDLPAAQAMTRAAQLLGLFSLWWLVRQKRDPNDRLAVHLEFGMALVLSLSLVGHAWQSYITWLIVALVPLANPDAWVHIPPPARRWVTGIVAVSTAALALADVPLYRLIGTTSSPASVLASLPNVALLALAFALALLLTAHDTGTAG